MLNKIFLRTKLISAIILLIISFSVFSIETHAEEESVFEKTYNMIYQLMDKHDYLLTPLADMVAGGVVCGPWRILIGCLFGSIDETLYYFDYTNQRYFTHGILGAATGKMIRDGLAPTGAGIIIGVLLPTGMLKDHSEIIVPIASAVAGGAAGGTQGLIFGGLGGAIDELAIYNNYTDKHYLTDINLGVTTAGFFFNPIITDFIGAALGLIIARYENFFYDNLKGPIKTAQKLYDTYSKFIPQDQLSNHLDKHIISIVSSRLLAHFFSLKIMGHEQNLVYNFQHLDNPGNGAWNIIQTETVYTVFLFPYAIGETISGIVDNYFSKKLHCTLEDKIQSDLYCGENILRLSHHNTYTVFMDNLNFDISTIVNTGSSLTTSAVSASVKGTTGIGIIIISSLHMLVYSTLYNKATSFIADHLASQHRIYGEKIKSLSSELIRVMKHDHENIQTILERDGTKATKDKIQRLSFKLREYESMQNLWDTANNVWETVMGPANFMLNRYFVANEINNGRAKFEERNKLQKQIWKPLVC